eukprot:979731-Prorocentrum_minimum.AAC.1
MWPGTNASSLKISSYSSHEELIDWLRLRTRASAPIGSNHTEFEGMHVVKEFVFQNESCSLALVELAMANVRACKCSLGSPRP